MLCKPETLTEDTLIATDFFGAGNLVVKINYFKLESAVAEGGMRKYSLMKEHVDRRQLADP